MAARRVARYLEDLHSQYISDSLDAPKSAEQIIRNLKDVVLTHNLSHIDTDLCTEQLFVANDSTPDLLTEFVDSLIDKRFTRVRYHTIKLVMEYMDHIQEEIISTTAYPARIHWAMMECVSKDKSDSTRSLALQCLDSLYLMDAIDLHSDSTSHSTVMSLERVIQSLNHMLSLGVSKVGPSVRGGVLRSLGILSNRYPHRFDRNFLTRLSKRYTKWLNDAMDKIKGDQVKPPLIAGSLTGIEYLLNEHSDLIPVQSQNNKDPHTLWTVMKMVIISVQTIADATRYKVAVASMNLLSRHSFLFLPFIMRMFEVTVKKGYTENKNDPLQLILNLSLNHGNYDVSSCGMDCVESMLSVVTDKLSEEQTDLNRKIFNYLMHLMSNLLTTSIQSSSSNSKPIALSIRAFGQLSSTISRYKGMQSLKGLLSKLVEVSKKCFVLKEGDSRSKLYEFPSFLGAFSSIIHDIDYVDDAVLGQLTKMVKMIYDGFPTTGRKLRERLYLSLTRLFVVLYLKGNVFQKLLESIVYRGITYSISTLPVEEDPFPTQSYYPVHIRRCYEEFYYFWRGMLMDREEEDALKWSKGLNDLDMGQSQRYLEEMRSLLFASLMENVITILGEFDLTFELKDDGKSNKFEDNAILRCPVDMELFLNFGVYPLSRWLWFNAYSLTLSL